VWLRQRLILPYAVGILCIVTAFAVLRRSALGDVVIVVGLILFFGAIVAEFALRRSGVIREHWPREMSLVPQARTIVDA
jgi:hypothetical protein